MRILTVFLLILCSSAATWAQNRTADIKIRLAQSYELSGDFETAQKLLEDVYVQDSSNVAVSELLRRIYLQLKKYDRAVTLIQYMLKKSPRDINLLSQLGSVYVLISDEQKAAEAWEKAIAVEPSREATYMTVGSSIVQSRLFDRAIEIYKRGRTACNDPMLFTSDIAYLYGIMLNYAEATREYLKMIRQNPANTGLVQSRIASYTGRADGLSAATTVVENALKTEPGNLNLHQLLAWLYMEGKQFDRAYNVYKFIDSKMNAGGRELYNFAERSLREKAYSVASRAFQDILQSYPKFEKAAQAKFGYAKTLEESDTENDTMKLFGNSSPFNPRPESESQPLYSGAITAYERVISEHGSTELAANSLLRIAVIKDEKFYDLDGARHALETLLKSYGRFTQAAIEGRLMLGDVYLSMGNLNEAESQYNSVAGSGPPVGEQQQKAAFELAQLDYFQEHFQDAVNQLKALTTNPVSNVTNDALILQIFIQENTKQSDSALRRFAKADLLVRQHKLSEALAIFESVVKDYPASDITDETLIEIGDIFTKTRRYEDAIACYGRLIKDFPESIFTDRTLMKMGQVFQLGLKDKAKAIDTYQKLLEKYPNSIYAGEARKRIRQVRGDSI